MDFFEEYGEEMVSMAWFEIDQVMMAEIQRERKHWQMHVRKKTIFLLKQEKEKLRNMLLQE